MEEYEFEEIKEAYGFTITEDWQSMFNYFNDHRDDLVFPLSQLRDSALHLATYCKNLQLFEKIYELVMSVFRSDVESDHTENDSEDHEGSLDFMLLGMTNNYGNTVLHEAVVADNLGAVKFLVQRHKSLVKIRNFAGETPFVRAASLGRTEIIRFLADQPEVIEIVDGKKRLIDDHRRREIYGVDDHCQQEIKHIPILHVALGGEHFETALQLLKLDESLAKMTDYLGTTAIQTLADIPSAFKSGSSMSPFTSFIYSCLPIEEEDEVEKENKEEGKKKSPGSQSPRTAAKRVYLSICKFIFKGWPMMERIWGEKKKHTLGLRIARLVLKKGKVTWYKQPWRPIQEEPNRGPDMNLLSNGNEKNVSAAQAASSSDGRGQMKKQQMEDKSTKEKQMGVGISEIALFRATRNGIIEIVEAILKDYPQTIEYVNQSNQNILHIAVMHREKEIFDLVKRNRIPAMRMKHAIDVNGYTLLHHVADMSNYVGGPELGPVLQLQKELQWFKRVQSLVPTSYQMHHDKTHRKKAWSLFSDTHKDQLKQAQKWIKETAQSCSAVAVLVATVVFAAAYTIPGGTNDNGVPIFLHSPYFMCFTIMDVVALASSLTSVVMFLSILTSPFEYEDFYLSLPRKLTIGFTLLFFSVVTTMLAFGATVLLLIKLNQSLTTSLISVAAFLPVSVFALMQFRLYMAFVGIMRDFFRNFFAALPWFCVPFRKKE